MVCRGGKCRVKSKNYCKGNNDDESGLDTELWENIGVGSRALGTSTEHCEVESLGKKMSGSSRKTSVFKQRSFGLNSEF